VRGISKKRESNNAKAQCNNNKGPIGHILTPFDAHILSLSAVQDDVQAREREREINFESESKHESKFVLVATHSENAARRHPPASESAQ
jgi:hypothetical protein